MNDMVLTRPVVVPNRSAPHVPEEQADIRLGMPHLSGCGLSETWLLKELGHRHWLMLAMAAGMDAPDFRDDEGRPVYAAFRAIRLANARLELGRENARLAIRSTLCRVSRTQLASHHELRIDNRPAGEVEMVSAFVRRTGAGNHSVARVALDGLRPVAPSPSDLVASAATLGAKRLAFHLGIDLSNTTSGIAAFEFEPCPSHDFNGAGFLYFPSFIAFVDRAEWQLDRRSTIPVRRDAFYRSNVDPGVAIRVILLADRLETQTRWWRLERTDERVVLADVFTQGVRDATVPSR